MNAFKTLQYEKERGIAQITLNRPDALNAFSIQMRDDLYSVLEAIRDDDDVRVAVLKGAGEKAFCAGADLSEFLTAPPPVQSRKIRFERDVWGLFTRMPQPFIAALHGYVLGSGIEMALCCDIRIASEDARFGLPEVALGIIPAAGGTQTLPRVIGRAQAMEMLLSNRWIDAQEAKDNHLVNLVVPKNVLYDQAWEWAKKIAAYDPLAVRYLKQAVVKGMDRSLPDGLDLEKILAARLKAERPPQK
ncbi:enoyl-CoA hydratase/isomerase family protein [Desulfotignum balticum]|uniref:enoyl-CoA hydratase/isomerase family protein n=1 Tax=Desulfotignum balticum TaxID=115781 RepID=UPI0003FDE0CA|nr:enoyl-CoA hydratase/isomerase family protein [Desulfotignum balticum]